jgi:hypothetical protein
VVFSTSKTKYTIATTTIKKSQWLHQILQDCDFPQHNPTTPFNDNQSTIKLSKNLWLHDYSKHIEIKYHIDWFLPSLIQCGLTCLLKNYNDVSFTNVSSPLTFSLL